MLIKKITYTDYAGNERTEDFMFNLSAAEVVEMEMDVNGGMTKYIQKMVAEQDARNIFQYFKKIIMKAYGEPSLDGKYFQKSEELSVRFTQTEAYSELLLELLDPEKAAKFIEGVIPKQKTAVAANSNLVKLGE